MMIDRDDRDYSESVVSDVIREGPPGDHENRIHRVTEDAMRFYEDVITSAPSSSLAGSTLAGEPDIEHSPDGSFKGFRKRWSRLGEPAMATIGELTDEEVAAFKARWRERRREPMQVLTPINAGPVERLRDEVQQLNGRVELLRSRADIADATINRLLQSIRLTILAVVVLTVIVVAL